MQRCPFGGLREAAAFSETSSVAGVGGGGRANEAVSLLQVAAGLRRWSCGIAGRFGVHPGKNVPNRNDLNSAHSAAAGSTSPLCHGEASVLKLWEGTRESIGEPIPAVRARTCGPGGCTVRHGCALTSMGKEGAGGFAQ